MIVVLDTSVLVAAIRSQRGASAELMRSFAAGVFDIAISVPLVFEYEEVVLRDLVPAFITQADLSLLINFLCQNGQQIQPAPALRPALPDADDDFILELAVAAGVRFVVTHNVRDFAGVSGIEAIRPGDFLRVLRGNK